MTKTKPTQRRFIQWIIYAVTAPEGFEKRAGQCKRFIRQICEQAGVPDALCPPPVLDAKQCAEWYREKHPELCHENGSVPGDILFWEEGHGPHGHVGARVPKNMLAENSTAHAPQDEEDGRGYRFLKRLGEPSLIVRVWSG